MAKKRISGFTLIELMIVVGIIGILAGIALPAYNDYVLRAKLADGISALSSLQSQVEQYYQDNRAYGPSGGGACGVATTNTTYFTLACTTTTGQDLNATATGLGFTYKVDQSGAKSTTLSGAPAGYSASTTCWVRSKGGC